MSNLGEPNPGDGRGNKPPKRDWEATRKERWFDLKFSHYVEILLTAALVGIAYFQYTVYSRQAGIMEMQATISADQNNLTKINERAFVFRRQIDMTPVFDAKGEIIEWYIAPLWENSGATPTKTLKMVMDCPPGNFEFGKEIVFCPKQDFRHDAGFYPRILGPHQSSHDEGNCDAMTPGQIATLPNHRFFMWGYARYTDVFDEEHKTRFCQGVILSGDATKPNGLSVQSIIAQGGNCTDEVCDEQDRQAENQNK